MSTAIPREYEIGGAIESLILLTLPPTSITAMRPLPVSETYTDPRTSTAINDGDEKEEEDPRIVTTPVVKTIFCTSQEPLSATNTAPKPSAATPVGRLNAGLAAVPRLLTVPVVEITLTNELPVSAT